MVTCSHCRHVNLNWALLCSRCSGDLIGYAAISIPAPLPAPMVEPIDTPQKLPVDSEPLPSRLALTVSLNEIREGLLEFPDSESNEIDFNLQDVADFPTMCSEQPSGLFVDPIHDSPNSATEAPDHFPDRILNGGTSTTRPGVSLFPMNDAAIQSQETVTTPANNVGDQSATPVPPAVPPKLLVLRGVKIGVEYPIYEGRNTIGRFADKPVDIDLLTQESVEQIWCSRQHAAITFTQGMIFIEDLNSLNKTWVNGACVHAGQQRQLKPGDVIQIGTVQMKLVMG